MLSRWQGVFPKMRSIQSLGQRLPLLAHIASSMLQKLRALAVCSRQRDKDVLMTLDMHYLR